MSTKTSSIGTTIKALFVVAAVIVASIIALDLTSVRESEPSHTDNGNESSRQEVEFRVTWAPESKVVIAYLVNFSGDQESHTVSPWSHSELAERHSLYNLEAHSSLEERLSEITCEIWVGGKRVAKSHEKNSASCSAVFDAR